MKFYLSYETEHIPDNYFPEHALFTINYLVESIDHGPTEYQRSSLQLISELLRNMDIKSEPFASQVSDPGFGPLI